MGRTEKFVRALHLVYHRLPAAVIDQSEQDIAYVPTRLTQFFNLDPPSRRADCACSTASLCQRDRLPSTRTPGSDLRVPESAIGSPTFGCILQSGLCSDHFFIHWRKGTSKRRHDPPSFHSPGSPREWNQTYDDKKRNVPLVSYLVMVFILWTEWASEESELSGIPK